MASASWWGVLVIGRVRARDGGDVHAETLAETTGHLREYRQAVLADERAHRDADGGQRLIVGHVQLVSPKLDPEQRTGVVAQALTKRRCEPAPTVVPGHVAPEPLHRGRNDEGRYLPDRSAGAPATGTLAFRQFSPQEALSCSHFRR